MCWSWIWTYWTSLAWPISTCFSDLLSRDQYLSCVFLIYCSEEAHVNKVLCKHSLDTLHLVANWQFSLLYTSYLHQCVTYCHNLPRVKMSNNFIKMNEKYIIMSNSSAIFAFSNSNFENCHICNLWVKSFEISYCMTVFNKLDFQHRLKIIMYSIVDNVIALWYSALCSKQLGILLMYCLKKKLSMTLTLKYLFHRCYHYFLRIIISDNFIKMSKSVYYYASLLIVHFQR